MKKALLFLLFLPLAHRLLAQWSTSGNNVYTTNATNFVGIGATPGSKLTVSDSVNYSASGGSSVGPLTVNNRFAGTGSNIAVFENSNASASSQLVVYTPAQYISAIQAQNYNSSTAANLTLNPLGGNVGIGITNPANKLEVAQVNTFTASNPNTYAITVAQDGEDLGIGGSNTGTVLQSFNSLTMNLNPLGNNIILEANNVSNVLIGETTQVNTSYKLDVNGGIRATGVTVNTTGADFVFDPNYQLPSLASLGAYLQANRHLPGVASADEMQKDGVELGAFTTKLLQKIEELTLYSVEADKKLELLQTQLKTLQDQIDQLKAKGQH